jgi:hypothetical protein
MARVADVLTATANNSNQTLTHLAEAMKYAAPVADEFGMSVEDTAKAIGTLADYGIRGSMAGTSLRRILSNLTKGSVINKLREIGVRTTEANGSLRGFAEIIRDIATATQGMTNQKKLEIFQEVFGDRAFGSAAKLAKGQLQRLIDAIDNSQGAAKRSADIMDSGLGGAFRRLMSAAEGAAIAVGTALAGALSSIADSITKTIGQITEWIDKHRAFVVVAAGVAASILGIGAALFSLGVAFKAIALAWYPITIAFAIIKGVLLGLSGLMAGLLTPVGMVAAGVLALGGILTLTSERAQGAIATIIQGFVNLKNDVTAAWREIGAALVSGDMQTAARIFWLTVRMEWEKGVQGLKRLWLDFKNFFAKINNDIFYAFVAGINRVWQAFDVGCIETVAFFQRAWNGFATFFLKLWERIKGMAAKTWNWIKSLFDESFDLQFENKLVTSEVDKAIQQIEDESARKLAESEATHRAKRSRSGAFHDAMMEEIARDYTDDGAEIQQKHQQRLDELNQELGKARQEWQKAIEESKAERIKKAAELSGASSNTIEGKIGAAISGLTPALNIAKGSVQGSFSGYDRFGQGGQATAERTAKGVEQIVKNTRDLLNHIQDNNEDVV